MSKRENRRAELISLLAAHFLETGLGDTGLRRLAEVAGTSDRMLLYYFNNKDELVTAVLASVVDGLTEALTGMFGTSPQPPDRVLQTLWTAAKSDAFRPHLRLWLDLSAHANRGDPLLLGIARRISAGWVDWMATLLDVPDAEKKQTAALMLAAVDGQLVLYPGEIARGESAVHHLMMLLKQQS